MSSEKPTFLKLTFGEILNLESKKSLISVSPNTTISDALTLLASKQVLHLPIQSHVSNRVTAIVGVMDLVTYLTAGDLESIPTRLQHTVEQALTLDPDDESYLVWERDYRDILVRTLIAFAKGTHRALITDALEQKPPVLLSQTDIIRFILEKKGSFSFSIDLQEPLSRHLLAHKSQTIVTMKSSETALEGYKKLVKGKLPALPILDEEGAFVGVLSSSDLRGFTAEKLATLTLPVLEFLKHIVLDGVKESIQTISLENSVWEAMQLMIENKVHRLWILEGDGIKKVVGVVSQSDIIGALVNVDPKQTHLL